jgi:hypothetical protein
MVSSSNSIFTTVSTFQTQVNKALLDINKQMNLKVSLAEISNTLQEQSLLNSALITELCLGRWIWKSLKTKSGMHNGTCQCLKVSPTARKEYTIYC